ncbi:MAG: hypothetical protein HDQ96_04300 [Lachnospiraceae bacterium]|nr:hypothetical protein [Lachnospiraceae bacterium]
MENQNIKIKRVLGWKPSDLVVGIGAVAALLILLVPLLRIALYAVPWYDDFNYAAFAKSGMMNRPGLIGAIMGAWECARVQWYAWQGTFSSIFFMSLSPHIWGEEYYCIGSIFLILILTLSVFVLMGTLTKKVLHVDRISSMALQAVMAIMVIELTYTTPSALFWYNAGMHYMGMHSFALLFIAVLICLFSEEHIGNGKGVLLILIGMLGAFLVAGSNFVTTLQGFVVLGSFVVLTFLGDWKKALRYLPILVVYTFAFYKNVSAPGNQVRGRFFVGSGYPPAEAILRSFLEAFRYIKEFSGWITLVAIILLIPIAWRIASKSSFSFKLPGLLLLWSFCLYATGFTPSLYSLGHAGISRTLNAVKVTYQILLVINEVYWIGWTRRLLEKKGRKFTDRGCPWWFYVLIGIFILVVFRFSPNQAGWYSSWGAYYYIHSGEAYNFHCEYQERLEILRSDEKNIVFEPYRFKPWMLCLGDLSEDPSSEENQSMASWYGKESLAVKAVGEAE